MDTNLPFPSGRQPVLARNIVATSQPLAAQAGAAAFARGGNAIDAALAAAITLTVVEPVMNGIGGDSFALVWSGGKLHGLNGSGRSPVKWDAKRFEKMDGMPLRGWDSVTVPGQVAGWVSLSERFGRLPFEDLFTDGIRHACDGFPVSPVISSQWRDQAALLQSHPGFDAFMPRGRTPAAGEVWRFADQGKTLLDIARTRGESFYRGALANTMRRHAGEHGGVLSAPDLEQHRSEWVEPINVDFHGHRVWEIPPNGQGIAALIALGLLEHLPYEQSAAGSAQRMHLEIEAMHLAFADLNAHVADPAHMRATVAQLLDPAHLKERSRAIDVKRASVHAPSKLPNGGTVYICTADKQGQMVSYIQSNYRGFGSGVVVPGTGISLHNRGSGFVTTPGHVNQVAGGKRPLHSIIPAFLTRGAEPVMAFGVMGGNMQAQGHVQMVLRHLVEGLNPQACSDAPRWRINDAGTLTVEPGVPQAVVQGLQEMGHRPEKQVPGNLLFGSAQLVQRLPAEAGEVVYAAGSDHRRDGQAVGC